MSSYYTLVGSRNTPPEILSILTELAHYLAMDKFIGRSGGANGADTCLEMGVSNTPYQSNIEVFLPWEGFNGRLSNNSGYINSLKLDMYRHAQREAELIHPNWSACSTGSRMLHTRNIFQVLGKDLYSYSKFLVCWAEVKKGGSVAGGTRTAVELALSRNIPVYNLHNKESLSTITSYIERHKDGI